MRMAVGLALTDMGTTGGVADVADGNGAFRLLQLEPDGFAVDFTDDSVVIKDAP